MRPLVRLLWRADAIAGLAALWLCGGIMLAMVVIAGLGVIFRFALHASLSWSEELDAYLFVWLTCLGAAAGIRMRAHPNVAAVVTRLPQRYRRLLSTLADAAVFALGALLAFYGGQLILLMGAETASSLPISMIYPTLAIPVGGALFMLHSLAHLTAALFAPATPGGDDRPGGSMASEA